MPHVSFLQVADALVGVLLAFNQHFKTPRNNIVLQCIAKRQMFRTLSEKILLLVNRETDPVAVFPFVHSVRFFICQELPIQLDCLLGK